MKLILKRFVRLALVLLLSMESMTAICNASDLATRASSILETRCHRCHGGSDSVSLVDVMDRDSLLRLGDGQVKAWIVPGKEDQSLIVDWVVHRRAMPPAGEAEAEEITMSERSLLREWIRAGAPFPESRKARMIGHEEVYESIAADLAALPEEQRRATRYFSLAHLYGNPKITDRSLRLHRAALSKTLHSLTWESGVHLPRVIAGADGSVLAIDLRDFGWSDREWDWWVGHDPYRVGFAHVVQRTRLREAYLRVRELAGLSEPVLRADWFVVNALKPALYYEILGLPQRLEDLETRLGVDLRRAFLEGQQLRAGFGRSHVSRQNRLLVRSPAEHSDYFWISYDFLPGTKRGDLHSFPLGPAFPGHPEPRQAFEHDGGEVIFALPSGMQAYFLIDGHGDRIDAGPIDVVHDVSMPLGSPEILNGISCVVCHREGMIAGFTDELREAATFGGSIAAKLEELHPTAAQMREQVMADRALFLAALEKIVAPFLEEDLQSGETLETLPEPVGEVVRRYRADLTLAEVAYEIGWEDSEKLAARILGERSLLEMGLGPLVRTPGATLSRDRWERVEGLSMHQEMLRELHLGASCWSRTRSSAVGAQGEP